MVATEPVYVALTARVMTSYFQHLGGSGDSLQKASPGSPWDPSPRTSWSGNVPRAPPPNPKACLERS